jgi:hypothetical protein
MKKQITCPCCGANARAYVPADGSPSAWRIRRHTAKVDPGMELAPCRTAGIVFNSEEIMKAEKR